MKDRRLFQKEIDKLWVNIEQEILQKNLIPNPHARNSLLYSISIWVRQILRETVPQPGDEEKEMRNS